MDYETTYPQIFKSTLRYSGGFFLIRFKPHRVVSGNAGFLTRWAAAGIIDLFGIERYQ